MLLDKTGTLTAGTMTVTSVTTAPDTGTKEALLYPGAIEDASEHPIGQAIAREAAARFGYLPPVTGFAVLPGSGVQGSVEGTGITVGSPSLFDDIVLEDPVPFEDSARVPLTLVFRHAGQITIEAPVTGPGTP